MSHVEEIKEKLSIVDVVGSYIALEKAGANFKAKCPFHNEKTASFTVSSERGTFYCFGCGAKGDVISFVEKFEGLDFMGALRILADRAGITLTRENKTERRKEEKMYLLMEHATLFFQRTLSAHKKALAYLKERGALSETIKDWRIGYAPNDWKLLFSYLKQKGFEAREIEEAGLAKKSEKVKGDFYDRFRGRIMFPIFDASNRVVAFSGRQLESDGTQAKYINSPETALYEKSKILYGYNKAKSAIREKDAALLVEGQMDLVMCHQSGFKNAVASSGTALTGQQLEILNRLSRNLIIAYDGDDAGNAATRRGFELALEKGMEVKVAVMPAGKDPADLVKESPEAFEEILEKAEHIISSELNRIVEKVIEKRELGKEVEKELLPYIAELQSAIERSYFISQIALKTGIQEDVLWKQLQQTELRKKSPLAEASSHAVMEKRQDAISHKDRIERELLGIILQQEKASPRQAEPLDIKKKMAIIIGTDGLEALEARLMPESEELIFYTEDSISRRSQEGDLKKYINELLANLEKEVKKLKFASAQFELRQAQALGNNKRVEELAEVIDKLAKNFT